MRNSIEVRDYMIRDPVKVNADAPIHTAIELIREHKVSGLCVVDDEGQLVGVLSELDCLDAILGAVYNEHSFGKVSDYMSRDMVTADAHDDILKVASDMLVNHHRRRPVLENGKLVGQITCRQLLAAVNDFPSRR